MAAIFIHPRAYLYDFFLDIIKFKLKNIPLLFALFTGLISHSQWGPQQIIEGGAISHYSPLALDIDDDGIMDILTPRDDFKLSWFRNEGTGNFDPEIIINEIPILYLSIDFVDLDTDGDRDILYLVNNPRRIAWLENLDGNGSFGSEQIILENQPDFIEYVTPIDLDEDGDLDLATTYTDTFSGWMVWYENLNGAGTFGNELELVPDENANELFDPLFEDIDNDGFPDILTSKESLDPSKIVWYKNLGGGNFGPEQEIYQFEISSDWVSIYSLKYSDINTDGKKDILLTAHNDDTGTFVYWMENLDNLGTFGSLNLIPSISNSSYETYDLDHDGDQDLLIWNSDMDIIKWRKNTDGLGNFGPDVVITTEVDHPNGARAADLNGDDLLDIISSSNEKLAWYTHTGLGISIPEASNFIIYPNPVQDLLHIESGSINLTSVSLNTISGKVVFKTSSNLQQLDLSRFPAGLYFITLEDDSGGRVTKKIVKK